MQTNPLPVAFTDKSIAESFKARATKNDKRQFYLKAVPDYQKEIITYQICSGDKDQLITNSAIDNRRYRNV